VAAYAVVDVGDLEAEGPGGMVRKVRRAVDAKAFGFNYFIFPPNQEGREHDHGDSNLEEVYFVVKGTGTMRIDGEEIELQPGRFVRVDPAATRRRSRVRHVRCSSRPSVRTALVGLGGAMHTIELSEQELTLLHSALHAYLDDFGHDEADVLRELKALIAKLPQPA
jgi:mannose-6-phosphate isomerase-like protein (cupin superfamily)